MASTKMFTKNAHTSNPSSTSFFHQQSSSSTNPNIDEDTALTHEMHVKMAKKIAQLTKVSLIFQMKTYLIYYLQIKESKTIKKRKTSTMSSTNNIHCVIQFKKKKRILFIYC